MSAVERSLVSLLSRGTSATPFGLEASGIPVALVRDQGAEVRTGFPFKAAGETPPLQQSRL